jgi:hypothetical protein
MITLRIDNEQFRHEMKEFRNKSDSEFKLAILRSTLQLEKLAKMKVRNFTRHSKVSNKYLINNIHKKITQNGLTGEVVSAADYSQAFEEGTRPHTIRVKNKKVLAGPKRGAPAGWEISPKSASMGYATYGKKVQHPGTEPHPFMYPAWRFACQQLEKFIKKAL